MNNKNNALKQVISLLQKIGIFIFYMICGFIVCFIAGFGIITIIVFVVSLLQTSSTYQGKTAQEWHDAYTAVGDCLSSKSTQWDSIYSIYADREIDTKDYSDAYTFRAASGWIYSGYNASSITSPTDEMKNCFTNNATQ